MREVPVAHDLPLVPSHPGLMRTLNDKQWVVKQFEVGQPVIAKVVGYQHRSTRVWEKLGGVMRREVTHPYLGVVDEVIVLLPETPVRLWLRSQTNGVIS